MIRSTRSKSDVISQKKSHKAALSAAKGPLCCKIQQEMTLKRRTDVGQCARLIEELTMALTGLATTVNKEAPVQFGSHHIENLSMNGET